MNQPLRFVSILFASFMLAMLASCGGSDSADEAEQDSSEPIVIGTSNSLTGALAPFELAINAGMEVAAAEINAEGGVDGRPLEFIHVDAKSDLNLSATATLEAIEKGADVVVPICDADLGGPGARAANEKGILAITCAGAPGLGKQSIGPLTFNTYGGSPTEGAIGAEYGYRTQQWGSAYLLCDQLLEYSKVLCEAFESRWTELGGTIVGKDTFVQTDPSIAAQVTRLQNATQPDVLLLSSFPAGSPALREIRAAYDGPILLAATFAGTFWLKATPGLSNTWVPAVGSSYGDDPRDEVNEFFERFEQHDRRARARGHVSDAGLLARANTREGNRVGRDDRRRGARGGAGDLRGRGATRRPDDLHGRVPPPRRPVDADHPVREREAELDRGVRGTGERPVLPLLIGGARRGSG